MVWAPAGTSVPVPAGRETGVPVSQKRLRWKGYVGRSVGRAPSSDPSMTSAPPTQASARLRRNPSGPLPPRRSVPSTETSTPACSAVCSMLLDRIGCGVHSTNCSQPRVSARRIAEANRTGCRRLRNQYSASSRAVSIGSPVTEETNTASVETGRIGASSASNRSRSSSTSAVCEAYLIGIVLV